MSRSRVAMVLLLLMPGCAASHRPAPGVPTAMAAVRNAAEKRAAFAQAYELFRHHQDAQALPLFTALVDAYPELRDYHLYYAAVIQERTGDLDAATAGYARLWREYPASLYALRAALAMGQLLQRDQRDAEALPFLHSALNAPDAATVQAARLALAQATVRRGDWAEAYEELMRVRRDARGSAAARVAKAEVLALRAAHPELAPRGSERLEEARLLLAEHDYSAAAALSTELLGAPGSLDAGEIARVHADAIYGAGSVELALDELNDLAERYPTSPAAPAALLRRASLLWNRDRDADAQRGFETVLARYPRDARADEALYAVARIHQTAGRSGQAIAAFETLVAREPGSKLRNEAQWRIGWIRYGASEWGAAAASFGAVAGRTEGRDWEEGAYWRARALQHAGQTEDAARLYQGILGSNPGGYYALWAQYRLDGSGGDPWSLVHAGSAEGVGPPPVVDPGIPPSEPFHLPRWQELRAAGVYGLARGELKAVERTSRSDPATSAFLVRAYQTVDGFAPALRLLGRSGNDAALSADERRRLNYPLAFWDAVHREAQANRVDSLLVVSVMRQESFFDPEARSSADARGLMQLIPAEAQRLAAADGLTLDLADLMQPDINIRLGVRDLRRLLDHFEGNTLKAVAAYNGGQNAVEKWERRFPGVDPDEFVEDISYRETRDYVKRVFANYRTYNELYR